MNSEIVVKIQDETEGGQVSKNNVGKEIGTSATNSKTEVSKQSGGFDVKEYSKSAGNQLTGGIASKSKGMLLTAANPAGMAMMALTMATTLYTEWQERKQKENERRAIMMRAGGQARNDFPVNRADKRIHIITGAIKSESRTTYRR